MESAHPFCVNLQSLSVWDYTNDAWQHRLFQKRTFSNERQREQQRIKQRYVRRQNEAQYNDSNVMRNNNEIPLDGYSRSTVMAKLDNVREYYNKLLLDVIQQQSQWSDKQIVQIKKENDVQIKQKKQIINKLKEISSKCDKKKEAIILWNKIQEMKQKNVMKKKEFQDTVHKTREHKKKSEQLKMKYDEKEQRLRQQKNRQKQSVQQEIDKALAAMTQ